MAKLRSLPNRLSTAPQRVASVSSTGWRAGKAGSTARGYDYRWQQYRLRFLEANPLCAMCASVGLVAAASVVDHITPHQGDDALFWDASNHQALCKPCHDGAKAKDERAAGQR